MAERYRIELEGILPEEWADWLGNSSLAHTPVGQTVLTGDLADQAALHGLLTRIRDLGIPILLIARLNCKQQEYES